VLDVWFEHSDRRVFVGVGVVLGLLDFRQTLCLVELLLCRVRGRLLGGRFVLQLLDLQTECVASFLPALFSRSLARLLVCLHLLAFFVLL